MQYTISDIKTDSGHGFSLIEILVVLSVLAIIALFGFGQLGHQTKAVHRKHAQLDLLAFVHKLHLYYQQHYTYAGSDSELYADFLPAGSSLDNAYYQLDLDITDQDQGFTLTARPLNMMLGDGALTINHYGDKRWYYNDVAAGNDFSQW